ncbi:hypothetical protein BJ742DRAFT_386720 [Cladochytrium replicatum]|nr:hypothetical protein BJ742DRAFT_386720 [Cladochytrium replicatum]
MRPHRSMNLDCSQNASEKGKTAVGEHRVGINNVPTEVLSNVFAYLSLRERLRVAFTCRSWKNALDESTTLVIKATPAVMAFKGGINRLTTRFRRLQRLSLLLNGRSDREMEALVQLGLQFSGHPALLYLTSDTSAVLRGARLCPKLRSLVLKEDFVMPIPHIIGISSLTMGRSGRLGDDMILEDSDDDYAFEEVDAFGEDGLQAMFLGRSSSSLKHLDLDCPLLLAVNRFSSWWEEEPLTTKREIFTSDSSATLMDMDVDSDKLNQAVDSIHSIQALPNLISLTVRSLHTESIRDFFDGWLKRVRMPSLRELRLYADEAVLPADAIRLIAGACPALTALHFGSTILSREHLNDMFMLSKPSLMSPRRSVSRTWSSSTVFDEQSSRKCDAISRSASTFESPVQLNLKALVFSCCTISLRGFSVSSNLAETISSLVAQNIASLEELDIVHCKFKDVDDAPSTIDQQSIPLLQFAISDDVVMEEVYADLRSGTAGTTFSNLRRLCLLGFGKGLTDASFIARHQNLEILRVDDISHVLPASTSSAQRRLLWNMLSFSIPQLRECDLRFTSTLREEDHWRPTIHTAAAAAAAEDATSPDFDNDSTSWPLSHEVYLPVTNIPEPLMINNTTLSNLTRLSLFAPPSMAFIFSVLTAQPSLEYLTISHIPGDGNALPWCRDADTTGATSPLRQVLPQLNIPKLKSVHMHAHGRFSSFVLCSLLLRITKNSPLVRDVKMRSTKPVILNEDELIRESIGSPSSSTPLIDEFMNDTSALRSPRSSAWSPLYGALQTAHIADDIVTEGFADTLISQCPKIQTLRLSGFELSHEALRRMSSLQIPTWKDTLIRFELSNSGLRTLDKDNDHLLRELLLTHRNLRHFEVTIERLPDSIAGLTQPNGVWTHLVPTDDLLAAITTSGGLTSDHNSVEIGNCSFESSSSANSSFSSQSSLVSSPIQRIAELVMPSTPSPSSHDSMSDDGSSSGGGSLRDSVVEIQRKDTLCAQLCALYAADLVKDAWWLDTCNVRSPRMSSRRIRNFLLGRIQANRQRRAMHG